MVSKASQSKKTNAERTCRKYPGQSNPQTARRLLETGGEGS